VSSLMATKEEILDEIQALRDDLEFAINKIQNAVKNNKPSEIRSWMNRAKGFEEQISQKSALWEAQEAEIKVKAAELKKKLNHFYEVRPDLPKLTPTSVVEKRKAVEASIAAVVSKVDGITRDVAKTVEDARKTMEDYEEKIKKKDPVAAKKASDTWDTEAAKLDLIRRTIDMVIVMDATGSMSSWLEQAKTCTRTVVDQAKKDFEGYAFRCAFIAYRDFDDEGQLVVSNFSTDLSPMMATIEAQTASGGGDEPEDVAGALSCALGLDWLGGTRLLIHIADAPAHGPRYNNSSRDDHPTGSDGLEATLQGLCAKRVDYWFVSIHGSTSKMLTEFQNIYSAYPRRKIGTWGLTSTPPDFSKVVKSSIDASAVSSVLKSFDKTLFDSIATAMLK